MSWLLRRVSRGLLFKELLRVLQVKLPFHP